MGINTGKQNIHPYEIKLNKHLKKKHNHPRSRGYDDLIITIRSFSPRPYLVPHTHQQQPLLCGIYFQPGETTHPCCCHILSSVPWTLTCLRLCISQFLDPVIMTTSSSQGCCPGTGDFTQICSKY